VCTKEFAPFVFFYSLTYVNTESMIDKSHHVTSHITQPPCMVFYVEFDVKRKSRDRFCQSHF
jgi:hypothetical protein